LFGWTMHLDPPTVCAMMFMQAAMNSGLLVIGWVQNRAVTALAYWAIAHCVAALGLMGLSIGAALAWPLATGIALIAFSLHYSLNLLGVRIFLGRTWPAGYAILPTLVVVAAMLGPWETIPAMMAAFAGSAALATLAAALEIWRGQAGVLRWSMTMILMVQAAFLAFSGGDPLQGHSELWSLLFTFQSICYGAGTAVLCVAMSKERAEQALRQAATTDALTGLLNRGAFVAGVESELADLRRRTQPAALLLFDLDWFKRINDGHGHLAGDDVLRRFAAILRENLRTGSLAGRLGGEEFAAFLPTVTPAQAVAGAERIRAALAGADIVRGSAHLAVTVSVGVCVDATSRQGFDALFAGADDALYRAKARGRDRVELNLAGADPDAVVTRWPKIADKMPATLAPRA
jgi:diguanylate cyclase (GGDEF)-like protein